MTQQPVTITLDVKKLYDNWQPTQKTQNIKQDRVDSIISAINNNVTIDPIIIEGFKEEGGIVYIRTADGRHRIVAFHQLELETIEALKTDIAYQVKEVFAL